MNPSEFDKIYKDSYPKVIRLCMGYSNGNVADAKDLAQDIFIKVWDNIENFKNQSSISTWIYKIAVNTCLMSIRKRKKLKTSNRLPFYLENETDDSTKDREVQFSKLYTCIDKLNKDKKAIILLELEGLPQKEIAEIIGIKHEAIRVRLHRIKGELTKCVKQ